jgi:hypothetical protein
VANDLLINAIRAAGIDPDQIAEIAGVDPRTAQRWLGGRVPHPRYRQKLAAALALHELELWPETARERSREDLDEIAGAVSRRSDPGAPDWRALLQRAEHHVDLLGYSLLEIAEARSINKTLTSKARAGCQIRIAIADPTSAPVAAADRQQRPSGRVTSRIATATERMASIAGEPGIELRHHQVATAHTILRFDDHLLLTIHLYGTPGFQAPQLHIRRERDYGLFDQLAKHFEDIWQTATPIGTPTAAAPAEPQLPTPERGPLDDLDYVWRPDK